MSVAFRPVHICTLPTRKGIFSSSHSSAEASTLVSDTFITICVSFTCTSCTWSTSACFS
eukprot:CAMPEP_0198459316 /NCGR_PEP_ID=MMETSP1453-20131121/40299_1 /TAXON_ID=1461543 ORGANISM="Unidentified sp., Strain RCC701" /NCGR_SAMPLE_ID=MMETSP1453 /ASSEMBLY_ACC=CAM_ASM_001118 /LENGTH=58 /DNA_ID=CAMNT_0044184283 /DNA_START=131 /DNA_END=304 /DNA_ORIENTATION=+